MYETQVLTGRVRLAWVMSEGRDVAELEWAQELVRKFSGAISHTFVLSGAVDDYMGADRRRLDVCLAQLFGANWTPDPQRNPRNRLVCFYNCSSGIDFAAPAMRKPFLAAAGLDPEKYPLRQPLLPDPAQALAALERAMVAPEMKGRMAVVIQYPELIWPNSDYGHMSPHERINLATLRRWATEGAFLQAGQVIVLVTQTATDLHGSLRATSSMIEGIEIPYPRADEREEFIASRLSTEHVQLAEGLSPRMFAAMTGGLSRILIDDIILRAAVEQRPVDLPLIKERKDQIIRQEFGELIEILEPTHSFSNVGGLDEVKDYMLRSVVAPLHGRASMSRIPSGVLLAGPPGTGKTLLLTALAREAGVNAVKLNAGRLLGQYVGNSERNLEKALACIRSLAPTIVMIDEIEQQFQRGGRGDGGVERRLFGRILEEMSGSSGTKRGEVIWFAATNRVDLVDAALRRPGRFDRIVPILPPGEQERWAILHTKLPADMQLDAQSGRMILDATANYTGADLDVVMQKANDVAADAGREGQVAGADILAALSVLRPSSDHGEVERMIDVALEHCNDLSIVPAQWRQRARDLGPAPAAATSPETAEATPATA